MNIDNFAGKTPRSLWKASFRAGYGNGARTWPDGGLQNRFIIKAEGRWDPSANTLLLKEVYTFDDGHQAFLTWKIIKRGETGYEGRETR